MMQVKNETGPIIGAPQRHGQNLNLNERLRVVVERIAKIQYALTKHAIPTREKRELDRRLHQNVLEKEELEQRLEDQDMPELVVDEQLLAAHVLVQHKDNSEPPPPPPPPPPPEDLFVPEPPPLPPPYSNSARADFELSNKLCVQNADVDLNLAMARLFIDQPSFDKDKRCEMWSKANKQQKCSPGSVILPRWGRVALQRVDHSVGACGMYSSPNIEISPLLNCRTLRTTTVCPFKMDLTVDDYPDDDPVERFMVENARQFNAEYLANDWVMHGPTRVFFPLVQNVATALYGMIRREEINDLDKQALCLVNSVAETWEKPVREGGRDIKALLDDVCRAETAAAAIEQAFIDLRRARDAVQITSDATLDPGKFGVSSDVAKKRTADFLLKYNTHRNLCARVWLLLRERKWYPKWEAPVASHALAPLWYKRFPKPQGVMGHDDPAEGFYRLYDALLTHKPLLPALRPFPLPLPAYQTKFSKAN